MKVILRGYGIRMTTEQRQAARAQAADMVRTRGTGQRPGAPRDVFLQSGPRGVLVNWRGPDGFDDDITGWRIYKDDEQSLFAEIRDPNTTQHFIESSAGSTPPVTNVFVSAVNKLNIESPLVQAQGSALTEAGAPSMPSTPPTYGHCFSGNTLIRTKRGNVPIGQMEDGDVVISRRGWKVVSKIIVSYYKGPMRDMGGFELVKDAHRFFDKNTGKWMRAEFLFPQVKQFDGKVYNLALDTDLKHDDFRCYKLANGWFAHNLKPFEG